MINIRNTPSLLDNSCTCGMEYDKCTWPVKDCKEFQMHRNEVIKRHKFSGWEILPGYLVWIPMKEK